MKIYQYISKENLKNHVKETLLEYKKTLKSVNLKKFNKNLIDPIKLLFDKSFLNKSFDEVIDLEINRQKDKTNNNAIGYFHQNLFKYFPNCEIPKKGWDLIVTNLNGKKMFVEIKNKHNTMNSSSAAKVYLKMSLFLNSNKEKDYICSLVEVISNDSQDIPWKISIDGEEFSSDLIRKISVDQMYYQITGYKNAFYEICIAIEKIIDELMEEEKSVIYQKEDFVLDELNQIDIDIYKALLKITFSKYEEFNEKQKRLFNAAFVFKF